MAPPPPPFLTFSSLLCRCLCLPFFCASLPSLSRPRADQVVFIDAKPTVRKQILRELQILHECNSKYIVSFYGAYLSEPHICMCMEFMDKG